MTDAPVNKEVKGQIETDDFGVAYIMWFCRKCNTMCQEPTLHVCARDPGIVYNPRGS